MKRISLILGIAALAAIAAPLSAQGNGGKYGRAGDVYDRNGDGRIDNRDRVTTNCNWWEVNCTNGSSRTNGRVNRSSTGWYQIGSDRYGNVIYERSTFDKKGRETIEIARRERNGRMKIIDKRKVDNGQYNDRYDTRTNRRNDDLNDRYERGRGRNR